MIPKRPVPDLIRDGYRFSDQIMRGEISDRGTASLPTLDMLAERIPNTNSAKARVAAVVARTINR